MLACQVVSYIWASWNAHPGVGVDLLAKGMAASRATTHSKVSAPWWGTRGQDPGAPSLLDLVIMLWLAGVCLLNACGLGT